MNLRSLKCLPLAIALLLSGAASAQYVWVDANGSKQFSDMPPPASVPRKNILKEPNTELRAAPATKAEVAPAKDAATAPMSIAERNADFQKRKMEQADKDQKAADATKLAADKKANCEKARSYSRSLEDGMRISSTDKNGERSFMTDEQRASELRNVRQITSECR